MAPYSGVPAEPPCQRRRWPRLIPIVESVIRKALPLGNDSWVSLRSALQDEQVRQTIEGIRPHQGLLRRSLPCDYSMLRHGCVTAGPEAPGRHERQPGSAEHILPGQLDEVGHQALGRQLAGIRRADTCCCSYRRFWKANRGQYRTGVSSGGLPFLNPDCHGVANRQISCRHVGGGGSIRARAEAMSRKVVASAGRTWCRSPALATASADQRCHERDDERGERDDCPGDTVAL
jgi:hypothetical protein